MKSIILSILICFTLYSCQKLDVYEKRITIPNHKWEKSFVPKFIFEKTKSDDALLLYAVVRHTNNYPYSNIHIKVNITTPKDSSFSIEKEIQLTEGNQNQKWANKGMDDIYEIKFPIAIPNGENRNYNFKGEKGKFTFTVENIMRDNPLPEVINIGIGLER